MGLQTKLYRYNFRLSDINCALGGQLKRIEKIVLKKTKIAKVYDNFFLFKTIQNKNGQFQPYIYPLSINFKKLKVNPRIFILT